MVRVRDRRRALLEILVFVILALGATWPLVLHPTTHIPQGRESVSTVPVFNAWTVWWNGDRLGHLGEGYWDAPIFFPSESAFALSEPQPTTMVVAPLVWWGSGLALAYNAYLILILVLNGMSAFRLLRRLEFGWLLAVIGGAMILFLPFVQWKLGVLHLTVMCGMIWVIHGLIAFLARPRAVVALLLGGSFAFTYLSSNHYGLFLATLLVPSVWFLGGRQFLRRGTWLRLLPGVLLAGVLVAPLVLKQVTTSGELDMQREGRGVEMLSLHPGDYLRTPSAQLLKLPVSADQDREYWAAGPGTLKLLLAAAGIGWGLVLAGRRRWTLFCLILGLTAFVFSLGPTLQAGSWSPYHLLQDAPGYTQIRSIYRFGAITQLMVVLLAVGGLAGLRALVLRFTGNRTGASIVVAVVGLLAVFEVVPNSHTLHAMPDPEPNREWITWLKDNTPPDTPIACVPFASNPGVSGFVSTVDWMVLATYHRRPIANGYSGYFPIAYRQLLVAMQAFPDPRGLDLARGMGLEYLVVRRTAVDPSRLRPGSLAAGGLTPVFDDTVAAITIYRLARGGGD